MADCARATQFAGTHPYCISCAFDEDDFMESQSGGGTYWYVIGEKLCHNTPLDVAVVESILNTCGPSKNLMR